ncbi:MAG: ABC transporter substrate-binding protein [Chloroflexota bacterium]
MKEKLFAFVSMLVLISMVLTACSQPATIAPTEVSQTEPTAVEAVQPTAAEPAKDAEPVEMHISWWGSQSRHDITIKVIEMFMAEYPHITITYDFASFTDYWTLMSTKAAADGLPCVMQQDYAYYKQYVDDGLLIPLDPYVADGTLDLSAVKDEAIAGGKVNDQLYALSLGTNSQSFVIDLDLFEQAGVAVPAGDWTWKDFEDVNMQIKEKLGIFGHGYGLNNPQILNGLYLSLGQGLYSDDGKSLGFTDAQPLIDYFEMYVRLQEAGAIPSQEELVANPGTLEDNPFVRKEAALYFAHTNQLVALWTAAGEDRNLQMVPVPRAEGATQPANYFKPSMFFSISSQCNTPKEAAMFIDYFTNSVEANEVLKAERGVPISSVVADALKPSLSKAQIASFDFLASLEVSPIRPPDPAKHNDILTNIYGPLVIDPMLYGEITPAEAVALYMEEANKSLAEGQ